MSPEPLAVCTMRCGGCLQPFDAMAAPLCKCVAKRPSVTCPYCGTCVCKWPKAKSLEFWTRAPGALIERSRAEAARRVRAGTSPREPDCPMPSVLVVDDDEEIRAIAAYVLQQMGYRVSTASDADEAMVAFVSARPDVVLTDALMPKLDGRELCRRLKTKDSHLKVVVMTSLYTGQRYRTEAHREFGADGYLAKPIDFDELHQVLQKLLARPEVASR